MYKLFFTGVLVLYNVLSVCSTGSDPMIGKGKWKIYYILYEEGDNDLIIINLQQSMLNRTHYVYSGEIITKEPLDESFGLHMDVCKYVDGGCKSFLVMTDDSFMAFANKFAEENIQKCFESMGIEPAKLPLDTGHYEVHSFLFDTFQLPDECTYGKFIAKLCAIKAGKSCGCIACECEFIRDEDDGDSCSDETGI